MWQNYSDMYMYMLSEAVSVHKSISYKVKGGGTVLPYFSYIGTTPKDMVFKPFWSEDGYSLKLGMIFK